VETLNIVILDDDADLYLLTKDEMLETLQ